MQVTQTRTQNRTRTQDQTTAQTPTRTTAVNRIQLMRPAKAKLPASHLKITLLTILTITYWISLEQIKAKNIVHAPPQKRNTRTRTRTQMISWLTPRIFPNGEKRTRIKWPLRNLKLKLMSAANVSIDIDVLAQKPWNDMAVM